MLAMTPDRAVCRRLCLLWGAHSILSDEVGSYEEMVARAMAACVDENFATKGQQIVVVSGIPFGQTGSTNNIRVVAV